MKAHNVPDRRSGPSNPFVEFRTEEIQQSIPDRFQQQVRAHPHHTAVKSNQHQLTYDVLNQHANRLARTILAAGARRSERVAVLMGNDAPGITAILAILKAGKSYTPLDPLFPRQRLAYALDDSQARLIVTCSRHEPLARELSQDGCTVLNVDEIDPGLSGEDLGLAISPDSLAQIHYTSGSSGRPKGVPHTHRDMLHNVMNMTNTFHLCASDRMAMLHSIGSIASTNDFFCALVNGATLLPWDFKQEGFVGLARWFVEEEITVWHWGPTPFRAFMSVLTEEVFHSVRLLIVVGEAVSSADVALYKKHFTRGSLFANKLGSTETFDYRVFFIDHETRIDSGSVPVGYALDGKEAILLDENGQEVGFNRIGEIAVRSQHLAQGYWRKPEETRQRFLPDPEGGRERIFLTGDLGLMRSDGCLEYHGRKDFQVKIRGYRVEVSEVELVMLEHPDVKEAVVVGREDQTGDTRLAAYVVLETGADTEDAELRRLVSERLPDYMMPAAFVILPVLPRTPSGKVDRLALPDPEMATAGPEAASSGSRSPEEETLVTIWSELLGVADFGVNDSLFELGGHSLLAAQILLRVHETFGVDVPLRDLLVTPTIAGLAQAVRQARKSPAGPAAASQVTDEPVAESCEGAGTGTGLSMGYRNRIVPAPEERYDPFPLTDIQEAYWVGRRTDIELGGVSTHYYREIDCTGLDLQRLNRAWQRVIGRHDMLRAIISPDGRQRVLETTPPYEFQVLDLSQAGSGTVSERLQAVRDEMSHQVLPGDRWPLFDIRVSLLPDERFRLHLSMDTLIMDARSRNQAMIEWEQFYRDPDLELPPLELSFRDFVVSERALRCGEDYRQAQEYWRSRLSTLPSSPGIPLRRRPDTLSRPSFTRIEEDIAATDWTRLQEKARRRGLLPTVLLLSAFAEVLKVWSTAPRFTVNLTLFNMTARDPQLEDVIGDFTSSTLVEIGHDDRGDFEAQAHLIQRQLLRDLEQSHVSGVQVIRELVKDRKESFGAIMPVVFTSLISIDDRYRRHDPERWLGDVVYTISQTPQVYLDFQAREFSGALQLVWDVVQEYFPAGMLQDMFQSYVGFLHRLADDDGSWEESPEDRALGLVPAAHLDLYAAANGTEQPIESGLLHTPFERQARRRPDHLAVVSSERTLTYDELYRRSNRVGHALRELGVQPNTLVGVVMEKGWEQVVAVLGILAAGGAYLPLDPTQPPERLRALLEDGEVTVVVTQPCQDEAVEWPEGIRRMRISADDPCEGVRPLTPVQSPDDLAYVIYTSGSTGFPKGVMIEHSTASNTILDINRRFHVGPDDRVLALSSLGFDLSVYDIFGTLAAGGTIVMPESSGLRDPSHWADLLSRERVTVWDSVPILMQLLVEYLAGQGERLPTSLRLALLSGDWIPVTLPDRIRELGPGVEVISMGGATEASIWSIIYPIDGVDPALPSIPYGKPMANQRFHVLNGSLEPCPLWVPGALYIGGDGLARGYWRDEAKTSASFITHPRTGERLYRTGDLGRYLPDGNIEFLGREDTQVKIQGYRVELGEIESVLSRQDGVHAAVAALWGNRGEEKRLVAYAVPEPGAQLDSAHLVSAMRDWLPEYMVPSCCVLLESLPLTANGKVDRQSLPEPDNIPHSPLVPSDAQKSGLEHRIASLTAGVLKLDELTPDESLLHLGATSVDMIRIANALEQELQFRPRMNEFYRTPTVQGLVALYDRQVRLRTPAGVELATGQPGVAITPYQVLLDPDERAQFKATVPGLRREDSSASTVSLGRADDADTRRAEYLQRRSYRRFSPEPVSLAGFSRWLSCLSALNIDGERKYLYGSAGGLYPVQTYLFAKPDRVEGLATGTYYYHPVEHQLVVLSENVTPDPEIFDPFVNRPILQEAAFALFLIVQMDAIGPMYGERSLHYATLEAGLIAQLLESKAPACGIGLCQIGDLDFSAIRPLFLLDDSHVWLHALLGGCLAGQKPLPWRPVQEPYVEGYSGRVDEFEEGEL